MTIAPADAVVLGRQHRERAVAPVELRRELSRTDTVLFLISAMVAIDTLGAIAVGGAQAFTWLAVLFVTFFIPSALASAELGAALPEEGGAYVWVREAFGPFPGALSSLLYWAGTPMWLGGSVAVVAMSVYQRFIGDLSLSGRCVFGILFVTLATVAAVVPLRYGKWVPASGAIGQIALLSVFTVTVVLYGLRHGVHGIGVGDLSPSTGVLIAVVPVLIYSFVGVELPSTAAEEMRDPRRDLPAAIARAGVAQALMYGVPTLAILVVLPTEHVTSLHGLIDAMKAVFTVYGGSVGADGAATLTGAGQVLGWISAALFIWVLLASGSAWIIGAGRAQAAACLDGGGPSVLGRVSPRTGVPVVMAVVSGAAALVALVANLLITQGDDQQYFTVALTAAIAFMILAYVLIYPAFLALRVRRPGLDRPFRAPGGPAGAVAITTLATGWSVVAAACLLWPGLGTAHPDAALPAGFEGQRGQFELLVLSPIVMVVAVGVLFHLLSSPYTPPRQETCYSS